MLKAIVSYASAFGLMSTLSSAHAQTTSMQIANPVGQPKAAIYRNGETIHALEDLDGDGTIDRVSICFLNGLFLNYIIRPEISSVMENKKRKKAIDNKNPEDPYFRNFKIFENSKLSPTGLHITGSVHFHQRNFDSRRKFNIPEVGKNIEDKVSCNNKYMS
tara:strand:+ start:327 stop:809 length:483 start_codon:yes stop_codon:yes gene_type:complete